MKNIKILLLCSLLSPQLSVFANDAAQKAAAQAADETAAFDACSTGVIVDAPKPQTGQEAQLLRARESYLSLTDMSQLDPNPKKAVRFIEQPFEIQISDAPTSTTPKTLKRVKIKKTNPARSRVGKIIIDNWLDLPSRRLNAGELVDLKTLSGQMHRETVITKEYVVESDTMRNNVRTVALAEKNTLSWMGRYLLTVKIDHRNKQPSSCSRAYTYYDSIRYASMLAVAALCFATLNVIDA